MSAMIAVSESIKEGVMVGIFADDGENSRVYTLNLTCLGPINIVKQKRNFHLSRICIVVNLPVDHVTVTR